MTIRLSRRAWLGRTAAVAAFTIIPAHLRRGYAANSAVNVAFVGVGGQGAVNRKELKGLGANIAGLCDVDYKTLLAAKREHPQAETWTDFREMLEKQKNIDAVMVSAPDHLHGVASMLAMKLGKHVCTETPLAHNIQEARLLALAARERKVMTQLDNDSHVGEGLLTLVEWLRSGVVGPVREVHVWTDRPTWPQGMARAASRPAPVHLAWDVWLGPAPVREYHPGLHPFKWRGYWDFGTGALGDMGCRLFDGACSGLQLGQPVSLAAEAEGNSYETGPKSSIVTYQFPERGEQPPVTLTWQDGGKQPPRPAGLAAEKPLPKSGSLFVGERGSILATDVGGLTLLPEGKEPPLELPKPFLARPRSQKEEWLESIRTGRPPSGNFADYGGRLTEVVLLGNVAIRAGRMIEWDPIKLRVRNASEADQFLRREYRPGWADLMSA